MNPLFSLPLAVPWPVPTLTEVADELLTAQGASAPPLPPLLLAGLGALGLAILAWGWRTARQRERTEPITTLELLLVGVGLALTLTVLTVRPVRAWLDARTAAERTRRAAAVVEAMNQPRLVLLPEAASLLSADPDTIPRWRLRGYPDPEDPEALARPVIEASLSREEVTLLARRAPTIRSLAFASRLDAVTPPPLAEMILAAPAPTP